MFDKKDKRRLYWLLDQLLEKKIDSATFCDEFYYSYDLELEDKLTEKEEQKFKELSEIASRFSPFEDEYKKYPKAFSNEEELRNKVQEVKNSLTLK